MYTNDYISVTSSLAYNQRNSASWGPASPAYESQESLRVRDLDAFYYRLADKG